MKSLFVKTIFALISLVFASCAFAQPVKYTMTTNVGNIRPEIITLDYGTNGYTMTDSKGATSSFTVLNGVATAKMYGLVFQIKIDQYYYHVNLGKTRVSPVMLDGKQVGTDRLTYVSDVKGGRSYEGTFEMPGMNLSGTTVIGQDGKINRSTATDYNTGITMTMVRLN